MNASKTIIKKYENRRLYDTTGSRYVNLEDVARMVRDGVDVQVVDARSGEDLTRVILTQIIMEDAKGHESGLPLDLLRKLIVASDKATHEFLTWYLTTVTEMYQKAQSTLKTGPLDLVRNLFTPPAAPQPGPAEELEVLRRRVQELENGLARSKTRHRRPRKKLP
ncbi:MAG TPA: polyhydroxyalkanoate synthesis regulator DNA-binding domain-containing protein [Bryobacteraceae bacterium]|nr:polyhydroxyalkanoate synthesis regulator DNA-binding domain-containing protein [Bryobacteraceae bacterium]